MANKQIDMRKIKQIFKLYSEGVSKRQISLQLGLSRNTITKYIDFFKRVSANQLRSVRHDSRGAEQAF
jgi:transposase